MGEKLIALISVPIFTGLIGYLTNWSGVWMLFEPVHFKGVRVPGVAKLVRLMPRRIQQIPGVMQGGVGWQGIIPSRAAKMGSIAVDKGIAKVGSPKEFYDQLGADRLADHILRSTRGDMRGMVEETLQREHPQLWADLPPQLRERIHERVQEQLPDIVHGFTDQIGENIDQLLDIKLMVIRNIEADPALSNRIFRAIGRKELKMIINFGFLFGFLFGIPVAFVTTLYLTQWWVLPIFGVLIGYATNWLAIWMIFEPIEPRRILGFRWQGLFLKRQDEVSEVYAKIIADEVVTLRHIAHELLHGPSADRTRAMIESAMRPAVDRAAGSARPLVRLAMGGAEYSAVRESVAVGAVEYAMTPLDDEDFNREQGERVRVLIRDRMRDMSHRDFSEMLRTVIKEDEWLLYLHGAVLGFGGGLAHLGVFG
ncbi:MAG: hypothetical protein QOJ07_1999 [Thermoleophilaceae bacterium]|nr:hypothetical protein [Thermoleophilaceae bacterium]